jgi:hypothetical protein
MIERFENWSSANSFWIYVTGAKFPDHTGGVDDVDTAMAFARLHPEKYITWKTIRRLGVKE